MRPMTEAEKIKEMKKCELSPQYFVNEYCTIYDAVTGKWSRFHLWPAQVEALKAVHNNNLVIVLKARQIGLTWLMISYYLWQMLFQPIATILIFSRRDDDATYLLGDERLRGMYLRLPPWMKETKELQTSSHIWKLSNGSVARAFPTTGGDSYTATGVLVDEADLIPDLNKLMRSTKPTIDAGGKLVLISRADKGTPESEFKNIYRGAVSGRSSWVPIFLPWYVRPSRDEDWYEEQKRDILARTGTLDDLYEQYPSSDLEALAPRSSDVRIPPHLLAEVFEEDVAVEDEYRIPGLQVFTYPDRDSEYCIGVDPAEGNPKSDDSALTVMNTESGEEVASLAGPYEPAIFAHMVSKISSIYNDAAALVERNNHGHAVLMWLSDNTRTPILMGEDEKAGWMTTSKSKAIAYDFLVDSIANYLVTIRNRKTYEQLGSIEGATLRAPKGKKDDLAYSFVLARYATKLNSNRISLRTLKVRW